MQEANISLDEARGARTFARDQAKYAKQLLETAKQEAKGWPSAEAAEFSDNEVMRAEAVLQFAVESKIRAEKTFKAIRETLEEQTQEASGPRI